MYELQYVSQWELPLMAVHKEHVPQLKSYDASQVHALHQLRHVAVANGNTARMVSRLRITLEIVDGQLIYLGRSFVYARAAVLPRYY